MNELEIQITESKLRISEKIRIINEQNADLLLMKENLNNLLKKQKQDIKKSKRIYRGQIL